MNLRESRDFYIIRNEEFNVKELQFTVNFNCKRYEFAQIGTQTNINVVCESGGEVCVLKKKTIFTI